MNKRHKEFAIGLASFVEPIGRLNEEVSQAPDMEWLEKQLTGHMVSLMYEVRIYAYREEKLKPGVEYTFKYFATEYKSSNKLILADLCRYGEAILQEALAKAGWELTGYYAVDFKKGNVIAKRNSVSMIYRGR